MEQVKQKYVVGLLLAEYPAYGDPVTVLVRKNRPEWQKGLLNGIGGKIEPGESSLDAMRREFLEETSLDIQDWTCFSQVQGEGYVLDFYFAMTDYVNLQSAKTTTDEKIEHYWVDKIPDDQMVPQLKDMMNLAMTLAWADLRIMSPIIFK